MQVCLCTKSKVEKEKITRLYLTRDPAAWSRSSPVRQSMNWLVIQLGRPLGPLVVRCSNEVCWDSRWVAVVTAKSGSNPCAPSSGWRICRCAADSVPAWIATPDGAAALASDPKLAADAGRRDTDRCANARPRSRWSQRWCVTWTLCSYRNWSYLQIRERWIWLKRMVIRRYHMNSVRSMVKTYPGHALSLRVGRNC